MIDTPKNLTRNILVGLILGFVVGAFLFYTNFFPSSVDAFVEKYIFKMGGDIFMNLLKLLVVPLVFFSLVTGISSLGSSQSLGKLTFKTVGFYLLTTGIAVSLALLAGSFFQPGSNYSSDIAMAAPSSLPQGQGIYSTIVGIFPSNIIQAMAENQNAGYCIL
jgi:Na+/H+-dicarboxylate symporter